MVFWYDWKLSAEETARLLQRCKILSRGKILPAQQPFERLDCKTDEDPLCKGLGRPFVPPPFRALTLQEVYKSRTCAVRLT